MPRQPLSKSRNYVISDVVAGIDKTHTIDGLDPSKVKHVYVEFTTVAGGGARQLVFQVKDTDGDVVFEHRAGITQAAALNSYVYIFAPDMPNMTARRDTNFLTCNLSQHCEYPKDFVLRVFDNKTIDVTDTIKVWFYLAR